MVQQYGATNALYCSKQMYISFTENIYGPEIQRVVFSRPELIQTVFISVFLYFTPCHAHTSVYLTLLCGRM